MSTTPRKSASTRASPSNMIAQRGNYFQSAKRSSSITRIASRSPNPMNISTNSLGTSTSTSANSTENKKAPVFKQMLMHPLNLTTKPPLAKGLKQVPLTERPSSVRSERPAVPLKGAWDQYQDACFDIQGKNLEFLFMEVPTPLKIKSLTDLDEAKKMKPTGTADLKRTRAVSRSSLKKFDKVDDGMEKCDKCNARKRRVVHLGCTHIVCRECLQNHIKTQIDAQKVPIKCVKSGCKYELDKAEINKYASNTEMVKKYGDLCVQRYVEKHPHQLVQCFTQGCGYVVDLSKLKQKEVLNCSRCKKNYCLKCHKTSHPGKQCEETE